MHEFHEILLDLIHELKESRQQRKIEFEWHKSHLKLATKQDLRDMERRIMSKISEWMDRVEPKLGSIQSGIDELQRLIVEFQNSTDPVTPEDQARLDKMEAVINALATDSADIPKPPGPPQPTL